jgi:SAM-dependent MidA family methyltransferase
MSSLGNPALVRDIIRLMQNSADGAIPFRDYMEQCLYHERYGYYRTERPKVGKDGDFYTSSSIGTIMGEMLAAYAAAAAPELVPAPGGTLTLVEFGGGSGRLAAQLLDALRARGEAAYASVRLVMIETSPYHRALQQEALAGHPGKAEWTTEAEWLERGETEGVLVLANELLDAFPVHLLEADDAGRPEEIYVAWDEANARFVERKGPLSDPGIAAYLAAEGVRFAPGQRAEVNLEANAWIARVCARLRRGRLLVIDYGDVSAELYAPHRMRGTLLGYRRHQAAERPYEHAGEQDLTAHVNFSACERAGLSAGAASSELLTQHEFLLRGGVLQLLQDGGFGDPFGPVAKRNRAIRQLLLSDQMSELFKVLILDKRPSSQT